MSNDSVVIIDGARTPMGALNGSLSQVSATDLAVTAIKSAMEKSNTPTDQIDEVYLGNVLQAGVSQGPARVATLNAGITKSAGSMTINKICGSGMHAICLGFNDIKLGHASIVVAGGMESMSNSPFLIMGARAGLGMGAKQIEDHMFLDGLQSAFSGRMMGSYAQDMADKLEITREQMDKFAIESLTRAKDAIDNDILSDEVVPVTIKTRKGDIVVKHDEQPLTAKLDKIPKLKPAFAKDGTITAANASSISDGASALILMHEDKAKSLDIKPMAKVLAYSRQSQEPNAFTTAPCGAIEKVLKKTGWSINDVDLFELNEAFAMVPMAAMIKLGIPHEKLNVNGGACAQGHPLGSSGSRIVLTLMKELKRRNLSRGVASICIGGGEALAIAIQVL